MNPTNEPHDEKMLERGKMDRDLVESVVIDQLVPGGAFAAKDKCSGVIRIDMSEYMERHTVSRLVGSPPGYVGHDEGGQLTEKVRRKPYSVVLFDEIEKTPEDVWNIMLQILNDGRITDSQGRTVDFKNTVIVMTSNIGAKALTDAGAKLGFDPKYGARPLHRAVQSKVEDAVAERMLDGTLKTGDTAKLSVEDDKLVVTK